MILFNGDNIAVDVFKRYMTKGKIIKGIGGFYYVDTDNGIFECKARGNFRKQKITPLVGDDVEISINENAENTIDTIYPRKNELIRPPLSNLDQLFIIASLVMALSLRVRM